MKAKRAKAATELAAWLADIKIVFLRSVLSGLKGQALQDMVIYFRILKAPNLVDKPLPTNKTDKITALLEALDCHEADEWLPVPREDDSENEHEGDSSDQSNDWVEED